MTVAAAKHGQGSRGDSSPRTWDGLAPGVVRTSAAERLRALGHPDRLRIVEALAGGAKNVTEVAAVVALPSGTVSRHLRALFAAQVVLCSRRGNSVLYVLADRDVARVTATAYRSAAGQIRRTLALVEERDGRP